MEPLYFVCHWIVNSHPKFKQLADASRLLECGLTMKNDSLKTEDGYYYFDFFLKVDSEKTLKQFMKRASLQTGFKEWVPTTAEHYSRGVLLADFIDVDKESSSALMLTKWLDHVSMLGRVNEALAKKQKK